MQEKSKETLQEELRQAEALHGTDSPIVRYLREELTVLNLQEALDLQSSAKREKAA